MEFETEEQQAEAVKKWFKDYGLTIILGLTIGLGGVFGFRYYETEKEVGFEQASVAYTEVMESLTEPTVFAEKVSAYRTEFGDNVYTDLLGLHEAKLAVDNKDFTKAESSLTTVMNGTKHTVIEHTARIRLARILIAMEKYEEALTTIAGATGDAYSYSYELLRGDVWMARGDQAKAKAAYEKAQTLSGESPSHPDLSVLLTELASVSEPTAALTGDTND